jgi:hypothetical protein
MPIKTEVIEKAIEEMRDNLVRLLGRVHELEGLEDFANSIELVMANSDSIDTISISTENWEYTLTIGALNIELKKEVRHAKNVD